jgi:hypothetical protein
MNYKTGLIAILSLILAACSGTTPAATPTPEVIEDMADPAGETSGDGQGSFEVTGDITAVVEGDDVYIEQTTAGASEIYILHINRADGTQLYIQFPHTTDVSAYTISNSNVETNDDPLAAEPIITALLIVPGSGDEVQNYLGVDGSFVLTEVGDSFSGNFQFTAADNPSAQPPVTGANMTANVTGDFENVTIR